MGNYIKSSSRDTGMVTYFIETKEVCPVIVICPGGGYERRSPREAEPIARGFNEAGFHAVVVEYNLEAQVLDDGPLLDLSWAVSELRSRAEEFAIDPEQIIVCGFSAGGHLAASLGVFWNDAVRFPEEAVRKAHQPNGMILSYPVISAGEYAHRGSFNRLAKEEKDQEAYSLEHYVTSDAPKCFIWHTIEDQAVPVQNTILFVEQLMKQKVLTEVMLFPKGAHGLSLATEEVCNADNGMEPNAHVATWFGQCVEWVRTFCKEKSPMA